MGIASINPATGETFKAFESLSESEIDQKLQFAISTFHSYRRTSFAERSRLMVCAAQILEQRKEEFGRIMTLEMGKPIGAAIQEAEKCAWACRYYAGNAERMLAEELVQTNASKSYIAYQPIGPVLAVMPWNFPFWQVFRFAAPALMAGNVGLLKHASNVPQCALAIEQIIKDAGFPEGCFQTLLIGSGQVARVIDDPRVKAATLTGSEPAGSKVASQAGARIKKTVLELGGSDPFIVMPSADLGDAVKTAVQARCINNGQSCIAAKRFIVADDIYDRFERQFVRAMESVVIGDPMDASTQLGPLATADIRDALHDQVARTVQAGARLLTGGRKLERPGFYYSPTVLAGIPKNSPGYYEELFGPVALLFRVRGIEQAVALANDSAFGLGSSIWTNDAAERDYFIENIESGMAFVNGMVASDPRLPFGGVKQSGYGRELGDYGIKEFVNIKTVWIREALSGPRTATE